MAFAPGVSTSDSSQVMRRSFSPPPSLFTFQSSSAVQPVSQAPILPQSAIQAPHNSADNAFWRFPNDLCYPAVFDPASVTTANAMPSSISSLGPSQVSPQVAGRVQPNLLHFAQPSHAMHDATGMPLIYSSLRMPAFQQDFVVGLGYNPIPHKTVVPITSGQYIDLATLIKPQPAPVPISLWMAVSFLQRLRALPAA